MAFRLPLWRIMILITTALIIEARPLVEELGLSACGNEPIRTFANEACVLVVTGTGGLRGASATGWAMGRFPEIRAAANVGFCGALPKVSGLHRWHYINSIRDAATSRLSVPDILWKHGFPEAGLLTSPTLVDSPIEAERLVDMEGSGFFEAARQFLSPDRIALLKWVSDPLTGQIEVEETTQTYRASLAPVIEFLKSWPVSGTEVTDFPSREMYEQILSRLRLSESQSQYLKKWVSGYIARGSGHERIMQCLPEQVPSTKRENSEYFERLKHAFKS